nr:MAG TPA: tail tape measure protein [Bacteriophage sp.]
MANDNESIEIKFVINSGEVMKEYNALVSGSKDVDKATESLKNKYNQMNAAQVLNAKGAKDVKEAINNIGEAVKKNQFDSFGITKENIELQKQGIKSLEAEIKRANKEIKSTAPGTEKMQKIESKNQLIAELESEKRALSEMEASLKSLQDTKVKIIDPQEIAKQTKSVDNLNKGLGGTPAKIKEIDNATGQTTKGVNKLTSSFNPLSNSVAQLAREVPAFTYSAQTGFMAISNNLPIFFDALKQASNQQKIMKAEAVEFAAAQKALAYEQAISSGASVKQATALGKQAEAQALANSQSNKAPSVLKQVGSAVFSWNTLLMLGVTILTVYGDKIWEWGKSMLKASSSADTLKKVTSDLNEAMKEGHKNASKELTDLELSIRKLKDESQTREQRLSTAVKMQKMYPEIFGNMKAERMLVEDLSKKYIVLKDSIIAAAMADATRNKIAEATSEFMDKEKENLEKVGLAKIKLAKIQSTPDDKITGGIEITGGTGGVGAGSRVKSKSELVREAENELKVNRDKRAKDVQNYNTYVEKMSQINLGYQKKVIIKTEDIATPGTESRYDHELSRLKKLKAAAKVGSKEWNDYRNQIKEIEKLVNPKAPKKESNRQIAEIFPEGSIKDLERRVALYNEAIDKGVNGTVKLQKLDRYGQSKDKKGNPYFTGEVVSDTEARSRRDKLEAELEEKRNAIKYKSFDEMLTDMEDRWSRYYTYQKEYGTEAANKQFPELKKQAKSFFDFLENKKSVYDNIINSGGTLTEGQKNDHEQVKKKIAELRGDKELLDNITRSVDVALAKIPLLSDQIDYLQAEMDKAKNSGEKMDKGVYSMLSGKMVEKKQELTDMMTEFINTHQSFEVQRTAITSKYAAMRAKIEKQGTSTETTRLVSEIEKQKQKELDAVNSAEYAKQSLYENFSQNLMGITKRELTNRIDSLEEYLRLSKGLLNTDQQNFIEAELEKAKKLKATFNVGTEEKQLLQQKAKLTQDIKDKRAKGNEDVVKEAADLEIVNGKLKEILAKKAAIASDVAGALASGFRNIASAIDDSNAGLADTLDTLGDIMGIAQNAAGAFASFASGDIVGGISQTFSAITGIFSIGKKARESEKKAREEMKKYQDSIFQSGLDYQALLRQRLSEELKINDAYKPRIQTIKDEMALNAKNKESILRDQEAVLKRLLNADTVTGMHTEKYGGFLGIGKKTRTVEELQKVGDLLGLNGYKNDPFAGLSDFMKRFMGIKNNPFANLFPPETIAVSDDLFDKLAKLNAEKPLTGDAKTAYEQLLKLKEEYGSIDQLNRDLEKQLKDAVTGTTAQSLADSIKEGILSGKKQFSDFADDIENFLRQGIIAGMSAKVIEPQIQKLQDELANMLGDGVLTEDEKKQFQEMYMKIASEASQYLDLINQTGLNVTGTVGSANSLQGAYKAASQESIDLLSGQTSGMRVAQLETNQILKAGAAQQMAQTSKMLEVQIDIERNTRRTAENTEELYDINEGIKKVDKTLSSQYNQLKAAGLK